MTKQVLIAGNASNNLGSQSSLFAYTGNEIWSSGNRNIRVACPGTITSNLVKLSSAPGVGNSRTFDVFKNNGSQGTLTVSGTNTQGSKTDYNVAFAFSDAYRYRLSASVGTPTHSAIWSSIFESTNANESSHGGGDGANSDGASGSAVNYANPIGAFDWKTTDDAFAVVPCPGLIKNLTVGHPTAPGTGRSREFEILKNGSPTGVKVSVADSATSGVDITHSIAVVAGDRISLRSTPTNSPAVSLLNISWCFEATNTNNVPIFFSSGIVSNASEQYWQISGYGTPFSTVANARQLGQGIYFTDIAVSLKTAPGNGKSRKFTLMINGVNTDLTVTLSDSETYKTFSTNILIYDFDEICTHEVLTGSPSNSFASIAYTTNSNLKIGTGSGSDSLFNPFYKTIIYGYLRFGIWFDFFTGKIYKKIP